MRQPERHYFLIERRRGKTLDKKSPGKKFALKWGGIKTERRECAWQFPFFPLPLPPGIIVFSVVLKEGRGQGERGRLVPAYFHLASRRPLPFSANVVSVASFT